jgi:predicted nucleotidyltransferase
LIDNALQIRKGGFGMNASAVICEFNPFHNGHAHIINEMKKHSDVVVCIMSGCFVQRGEAAISSPYLRAQIAVTAGADLVLELPFPYSSSSAEGFAEAGVNIAARIGCRALFFGSESQDVELLQKAAEATLSANFAQRFAELSKTSQGTAAAFTSALSDTLGISELSLNSNDILGISYIKAIKKCDFKIEPHIIKRLGDSFNSETVNDSDYPSATALRNLIYLAADDPLTLDSVLDGTMPSVAKKMLINCNDMPATMDKVDSFIHAFYRLAEPEQLEKCAEMSGGLAHKICRAARETINYQDLFASLRNKHHTDAHLRRAVLFGILGVTREDMLRAPEYTTLLASSSRGREYLKSIRKTREIEIVTKNADAPVCRQTELAAKAKALFSLCLPNPKDAGYELRFSPFVGD